MQLCAPTKISAPAPVRAIVIGASTGGPAALEFVLSHLPRSFPVPVLVAQHMPQIFVEVLVKRLRARCSLPVHMANSGSKLAGGAIWLARGDCHMYVETAARGCGMADAPVLLRLEREHSGTFCRPSVDHLFHSAAAVFGSGTVAVVMTGMGSDGLEGARCIFQAGGVVLAQDEATSAVWGMPGRVYEAGLAKTPLSLTGLVRELLRLTACGHEPAPAQHAHPAMAASQGCGREKETDGVL